MVALMFVLAIVAALAGIFAAVIQQMAKARRQQYLDDLAIDSLACASLAEPGTKGRAPEGNPQSFHTDLPQTGPQSARPSSASHFDGKIAWTFCPLGDRLPCVLEKIWWS